ncbi:MAG: hypothetical protein H0V81_03540 [Solirubrobacterales bacterium]|nr:hypothetical protein [Solirubrobacterales bacterium]
MAEHLVVLSLTPEAIAALPAASAALREHVLGADALADALDRAAAELPVAALAFTWETATLVADLRRPPVMGERQADHDYEVGLQADDKAPRRIVLYARDHAHALEAGEDFARTCLPRGWSAAAARRAPAPG